jgi:hypothetical protein
VRLPWIVALACLAAAGPVEARRLHLHHPARGFQMRMMSFVLPPDGEREACQYLVTPNKKPVDIAAFDLKTTPGTHHFVLWEYLGQHHDPADFWSGLRDAAGCVGLGPQDGFFTTANLFGMLSARVRVRFPPGVAVRLEPHAAVYADLHLHNYSSTRPVTGEAVFNVIPARRGTVRHHAQAMTIGSFDIQIPARGDATLTGEWHAPVALNVVQLSTHQHHRGTRVSVHQIDAAGADMGELVESPDWEHPTVRWFEQALRIPAGEGFRFTCDWHNPDDHPVGFGVTTDDEMCFMTGYFYPDDDGSSVTGQGCTPQGSGLECVVNALR